MAKHESRVLMWNLCEQVPSHQCGQHQQVQSLTSLLLHGFKIDHFNIPPPPPHSIVPPCPRPGQANAKVVHADVELIPCEHASSNECVGQPKPFQSPPELIQADTTCVCILHTKVPITKKNNSNAFQVTENLQQLSNRLTQHLFIFYTPKFPSPRKNTTA